MSNDVRLSEIIGPAFFEVHKDVKAHNHTHYMLGGGRGSLKSSFVSIETPLLMKQHPNVHAIVFRKIAADLKHTAYEQYVWGINKLGIAHEFIFHISPMEIIYKPTGQKIMFRGLDDWSKTKSIKTAFGYVGITHFEELDQFAGRKEIRRTLQSTMRGGDLFWNFETYNPPITQANWVNRDRLQPRPDRLAHYSNYLQAPAEWLGEQFLIEAERTKELNERAYLHEYMGEVTGTGGAVFENVITRPITDDEIKQFDKPMMGVDWGYYPHPWAWCRVFLDQDKRILYVYDELTAYKKSNAATVELLRGKGVTSNDILIADSADNKSIGDYVESGFYVLGAEKQGRDYSFKWLQGLSQIVIDPERCPNTADEFLGYEYERTRAGEIISGYPKIKDDHIDAVRYALNLLWRQGGK